MGPEIASRVVRSIGKMGLGVKKRWWIVLAALGGVGVLGGIVLVTWGPEVRSYHGKSIKAWALQLGASPRSRAEATEAFKALGTNAVPGLVRLLQTRDSLWRQATWRLAPRLPAKARQAIIQNMRAAVMIRTAAARSLRVIGPEAQAAVPALARALREDEAQLRWEAAGALGAIGGPARAELVAALTNKDPNVRRAAAYGLGESIPPEPATVEALLRALGDQEVSVRAMAASSVSALGTNALAWVMESFRRGDVQARQSAARAFGALRSARDVTVPALVEMSQDKNPASRLVAIQTLAGLGLPNRQMIEAYKSLLKDPAEEVRLAAVLALSTGRFHAKTVLPALTECLGDDSPKVREGAARALGAIGAGAKPALPELARLAQDKEEPVRAAAKEAAARIESMEAAKAQP
jgi:HEAT repeat protein